MSPSIRHIDITPLGKVRMVKSDSWKKRPSVLRYWAYKDELKLKLPHYEVGPRLAIRFNLSMPPSWSQKKKDLMCGTPHQQKPDIDNDSD